MKPDSIPQDVWDAALGCMEYPKQASPEGVAVIARAILAERERCAKIVEAYPPDGFFEALHALTERHDEFDPIWKFKGDTGNWAYLMGRVLEPYAAAIRRGSP